MYWKEKILYITLSLLKILFPFMKIKPNKIVFVSLESNKLENEFKMLSKQLMKDNRYDLQYDLFKFDGTLLGSIKYFFVCIHQFFEINTSKLVILDYNNYVVSKFKRMVFRSYNFGMPVVPLKNLVMKQKEIIQ